jgi:hypothetical protein
MLMLIQLSKTGFFVLGVVLGTAFPAHFVPLLMYQPFCVEVFNKRSRREIPMMLQTVCGIAITAAIKINISSVPIHFTKRSRLMVRSPALKRVMLKRIQVVTTRM